MRKWIHNLISSIFETDLFLIHKDPTIFEYVAFFCSIRILQYYTYDNDELPSSLWVYGMHTNNPEIINFWTQNDVNPIEFVYCKLNYIAILFYDGVKI